MRAKTIGTNYNGANFLITQNPDLMLATLTRDIELMELILCYNVVGLFTTVQRTVAWFVSNQENKNWVCVSAIVTVNLRPAFNSPGLDELVPKQVNTKFKHNHPNMSLRRSFVDISVLLKAGRKEFSPHQSLDFFFCATTLKALKPWRLTLHLWQVV